jgi:hypothetical protein
MILECVGNRRRKAISVDGKRAAGRDLVSVGCAHDQGSQPAHFGMEKPDSVVGGVVGAKGIRTNEFSIAFRSMRLCHPSRTHLVKNDANASIRCLPGRFGAGKTAADNVNGFRGKSACHAAQVARFARKWNARVLLTYDNARHRGGRYRL